VLYVIEHDLRFACALPAARDVRFDILADLVRNYIRRASFGDQNALIKVVLNQVRIREALDLDVFVLLA